jgi:hypothetical protein
MHRTITALTALMVAAAFCVALQVASAMESKEATNPKKPDATIELKGEAVAVGVGVSWESGTLTYKGKVYPISVTGLDVGDVGIARITASGKVYDLKKLADFNGNYAAVGAEATIGGGASAIAMENQNRVRVNLVSTTQGVKLALATGGVGIKINK